MFRDTKIYFCTVCKKVIDAKIEPQENVEVTISIVDLAKDVDQNYYDPTNLEEWK